jgi:antirestriction protein ArdC
METNLKDIYSRITSQIVQAIERGAPSFRMPWHQSGTPCFRPLNALTNRPYQGVNAVSLWAAADAHQYPSGIWATYNQWQELGAQVRKGEKSSLIVVWKEVPRKEKGERQAGEGTEPRQDPKGRLLLGGGYYVFNAAQVDGYEPAQNPPLPEDFRIEQAERFFSGLGANIRHEGDRALYRIEDDVICLPSFGKFRSALNYYATLAHEITHWTGAAHRLNRQLANRFGDDAYAMEELIAELGAAFICSQLAIVNEARPDHASYIQSWLKVLKRDTRAIFVAASKAQQAADWLCDPARTETKQVAA